MGQPVVHFEIQGGDREALGRFYQQLFDWKTTDVSQMNYTMVETGGDGGINGGIGETPEGSSRWGHLLRPVRRRRRLLGTRR
jgi:predicted enzyme related to lactoylglutathione lyase